MDILSTMMGAVPVGTAAPATRKIADASPLPCIDRQHSPPSMQVFSPGTWEHTCPSCGTRTVFTVSRP